MHIYILMDTGPHDIPTSKKLLDLFTNKCNDLFIRDETSGPFLILRTHEYAHSVLEFGKCTCVIEV